MLQFLLLQKTPPKNLKKQQINTKNNRCLKVKGIKLKEDINKIALTSNDDKRMESFDSIETYSYETSAKT